MMDKRESNKVDVAEVEVTDSDYIDMITKQIQEIALEIENLPGEEALLELQTVEEEEEHKKPEIEEEQKEAQQQP